MKIGEDRTILSPLRYAFTRRAPYKVNKSLLDAEKKVNKLILILLERAHMLEVGSGLGRWTEILVKNKIDVTGCDVLPKSIEILKNRFPNVKFKLSAEKEFPFKAKEFDAVSWANVVNTKGLNKYKFYKEIHRILKDKGKLIFLENRTDLKPLAGFEKIMIVNLGMGFSYSIGRFLFILPKFAQNIIISGLKLIDSVIYPYFSVYKLYIFQKIYK